MIKYSLCCSQNHEFEGWFSSADEFDRLSVQGHMSCAVCGDGNVVKSLMAPSVQSSRSKSTASVIEQSSPIVPSESKKPTGLPDLPDLPKAAPKPDLSPQQQAKILEEVRAFRDQVTKNAENVGDRFSEEARKIHYGEAEDRGIIGKADAKEAAELVEEGIPVIALPDLPEDKN